MIGENASREELLALLNTPEVEDFDKAVPLEAAHQVLRWGVEHDNGKQPEDWFWVVGYLAGKALRSHAGGDREKALHHTITIAALCRNWHAHIRAGSTLMRPGIESPEAVLGAPTAPPTSASAPSVEAMAKHLRRRELPLLGSNQDSPDPE